MTRSIAPEDQPIDDVDIELLKAVAELHRSVDPVPAGLVEDITFALSVQALHAEVAAIVESSAQLAGVRSDYAKAQTVTFSADSLSVMVTLSPERDDQVRIDGWVTGCSAGVAIEVRTGSHCTRVDADEDGRFVIQRHPRGLASFTFHPADPSQRPVMTPLVEI